VSAKEAGKLKNVGPAVSKTEVARQALEAKRILDDANLVPDDGIPPGVPVNVRTEALRRGVRVTWNAPPEEEYVEKTRVKVTNAVSTGRVLLQEAAAGTSATVVDLPTEEHLVEVQHVDQWGLTSPWSAFVTVTPLKSVADLIDLAAAEIAGKLGWTNIAALTDPANLGDKVITSRAMATQNFAALSAWIEGAAIKDALIGDLKADKITTGNLTAEIGITTGKLTWPGGLLDPGGMTLGNLAKGASALPQTSPASWITSMDDGEAPSPASGITAFRGATEGLNRRGLLLVAQGVKNSGRNGMIRLLASIGSDSPHGLVSSAFVDLISRDSGGSVVSMGTDIRVERDAAVIRDLAVQRNLSVSGTAVVGGKLSTEYLQWRTVSGTALANGSFNWQHGFSNAMLMVMVFYLFDGRWIPAETSGGGIVWSFDGSAVYVTNTNSTGRSVRIAACRCDF
jgi:hypothetical protein